MCKSVISDPGFLSLFLLKYCSADLVERQYLLYQEWRETWEYEEGKEELTFLTSFAKQLETLSPSVSF